MKSRPDPPPFIERHSRKCAICTHPDRQAIDEAFLDQSGNPDIVKDYNLPSLSSLYRHAHATGLRVRTVNRLRDCESIDSARQEHDRPNSNRESNRENKSCPADQTPTEPNSNRESNQLQNSNRENDAGSGLMIQPGKVMSSGPARMVMTAEIQRMLIGK
jgi:hypothetical protein